MAKAARVLILLFMIGLHGVLLLQSIYAQTEKAVKARQKKEISFFINGNEMPCTLIEKKNIVFIPAAEVARIFHMAIKDSNTFADGYEEGTILLGANGHTVKFIAGSFMALVDGQSQSVPSPVFQAQDDIYVPLSAFCNFFAFDYTTNSQRIDIFATAWRGSQQPSHYNGHQDTGYVSPIYIDREKGDYTALEDMLSSKIPGFHLVQYQAEEELSQNVLYRTYQYVGQDETQEVIGIVCEIEENFVFKVREQKKNSIENKASQREIVLPSVTTVEDNAAESKSALFILKLLAKDRYSIQESVEPTAEAIYIGNNPKGILLQEDAFVTICIEGGIYRLAGVMEDTKPGNPWLQNKTAKFHFVKNLWWETDGPDAAYWENYYQEEGCYLPKGKYVVTAIIAGTMVHANDFEEVRFRQEVQKTILVE